MTGQPTHRGRALTLLRRALADPGIDFREGQWEAIEALVNRRERLLVIERTGWGKSAVYFIATRILRDRGQGPTLIVSPLLALMRNQVEAASRLGIRALTINSTNRGDWPQLRQDILADQADALIVSPERLANDEFVQSVLLPVAERLGLLVVDEVHCISDWGHDFRPDYRRLIGVVQRMPRNMPILGTTATANDRVVADVQAQLGAVGVQRGPLIRESLALQTLRLPDQSARLAWLAEHVPKLPGTGIVYTLTKHDADQVATWLGHPIVPEGFATPLAADATRFLRRAETPLECKKQVLAGAFTKYGFAGRLPVDLRAETGRILSRWGDAGWGRLVAEDKHAGQFRDELVEAVAEMIRERWRPTPPPAWVTCVPSNRHPDLVPTFAQSLASRLRLPFVAAVSKVLDNELQKRQENSYRRCRNLDGVFAVEPKLPPGPALLVDDVVDSAWTLTVIAALLREAGSGPVWPVALATSGVGD